MEMKGIYAAMVTAFQEDGSLDERGIREIVRHNIDHCGVKGLFVGGTMGERYKMSTAAMKELYHIVADETAGKVDLVANISALAFEEVLELSLIHI